MESVIDKAKRKYTKCINCNKNIRVYFPVGWCHFNGIVPCFPDAEEGTREYNMVATPRITLGTKEPEGQ